MSLTELFICQKLTNISVDPAFWFLHCVDVSCIFESLMMEAVRFSETSASQLTLPHGCSIQKARSKYNEKPQKFYIK
jgi:hypothetical protein